jgi:hypothetical protein
MTAKTHTSETPLSDWAQFERNYLESGVPNRIVVQTAPLVEIFVDPFKARLGARFEARKNTSTRPGVLLQEICVNEISIGGRRCTEISTESRSLYPSFYSFLGEVINDTVVNRIDPVVAIENAVARWNSLLQRHAFLSEECQTGLYGELWLLRRLIEKMGIDAIAAWVGPGKQAHDFRVGNIEFEVKSTTRAERVHRINGASQLVPSIGCSLYILSIQVANAGDGGESLPEVVAEVLSKLAKWEGICERFRQLLDATGYSFADEASYETRRRLRTDPALIFVADGIPRLTTNAILGLGDRFCPQRISNLAYDIDVSGFGHLDGSRDFLRII